MLAFTTEQTEAQTAERKETKDSFTYLGETKLAFTANQFNREFIIRYYEDSKRLSRHKLIGFSTMCEIIGEGIVNNVLNRVMDSMEQNPEVKLRRGIMFRFFRR